MCNFIKQSFLLRYTISIWAESFVDISEIQPIATCATALYLFHRDLSTKFKHHETNLLFALTIIEAMNLHGLYKKCFYFLLGFVYHTTSVAAYLIFVLFRFIVHIRLDKNKYRLIDSGSETIMAESTNGRVNVVYVLRCMGTPTIDKIVDRLYQIVKYETTLVSGGHIDHSYRPFEKLGYVIVKQLGVFCWNVDHNFRAENHLVVDMVNRSLDVEVQERCERLLDTVHANHQPQWEMHILERSESAEYAIVWSVHHSYGDGTIFTQLMRYTLADDRFPLKINPLEWNRQESSLYSKVKDAVEVFLLCTIGSGWIAACYGQGFSQEHVRENDMTESRGRSHCRAVTLNLTDLKAIQRKLSKDKESPVRLVSILYSYVSPAFERAMSSSKLKRPSTILASTVEADYPYKSLQLCVNVYSPWFDLPLNVQPLQERLDVIDTRIKKSSGHLGMSISKIQTNLCGAVVSLIPGLFETSVSQAAYISNMVGAQDYFTIFGGDVVTAMYVYSPVIIDEVVTIDAYSYGDKITLAMVTPDRVMKKFPKFLDDFAEVIKDEMIKYIELSKTE